MSRMSPAPRITHPKISNVAFGLQLRNCLGHPELQEPGTPESHFVFTISTDLHSNTTKRNFPRNWATHSEPQPEIRKKQGTGHKPVMFTTHRAQRGKLLVK